MAGGNAFCGESTVSERDLSTWNQLGRDIDADYGYAHYISSLSLSSDGNIVAIVEPVSPRVRIFEWNETEWTQLGSDIDGEVENSPFGTGDPEVSLSSDGSIVASVSSSEAVWPGRQPG